MLMVILWFIPALTALATPGSCVLYTVQISRDQDINRRPELHSVLVVDNLYDLMMQQSVQSCIASISHLTSPQNMVSSHHFYLQKNKRFRKSLMRNSSFIFVHNNTSKTVYFAFLFNYRKENLLSRRLRKTEKTSIFCICKKMKLKKKKIATFQSYFLFLTLTTGHVVSYQRRWGQLMRCWGGVMCSVNPADMFRCTSSPLLPPSLQSLQAACGGPRAR